MDERAKAEGGQSWRSNTHKGIEKKRSKGESKTLDEIVKCESARVVKR